MLYSDFSQYGDNKDVPNSCFPMLEEEEAWFPIFFVFCFLFCKVARKCSHLLTISRSCSQLLTCGSQWGSGAGCDICDAEDVIVFADKDDGDSKAFLCVNDVAIASGNGMGSIF